VAKETWPTALKYTPVYWVYLFWFFVKRNLITLEIKINEFKLNQAKSILGLNSEDLEHVKDWKSNPKNLMLRVLNLDEEDLKSIKVVNSFKASSNIMALSKIRSLTAEQFQKLLDFIFLSEEEILLKKREENANVSLLTILNEIHAAHKNARNRSNTWKTHKDAPSIYLRNAYGCLARCIATDSMNMEDFKDIVLNMYYFIKFKK